MFIKILSLFMEAYTSTIKSLLPTTKFAHVRIKKTDIDQINLYSLNLVYIVNKFKSNLKSFQLQSGRFLLNDMPSGIILDTYTHPGHTQKFLEGCVTQNAKM